MPSFRITVSPKRRAAARFISTVRRAFQRAVAEERAKGGINQSEIGRRLDVHRSVISRELRGIQDMTLGRVGELAWALELDPVFVLNKQSEAWRLNLPYSTPAGSEALVEAAEFAGRTTEGDGAVNPIRPASGHTRPATIGTFRVANPTLADAA